jgi:hypothetical protein
MTYNDFIDELQKLTLPKEYAYLPSSTSGQNLYTLLTVSLDEIKVERDRKEISISTTQIKKILDTIENNKPLDVEATLGGSGNARSIVESLMCLNSHIFYTRIQNRKHIVYLPHQKHDLGNLTFIEEKEIKRIAREEIKKEFQSYLENVISKKSGKHLTSTAISSYMIFTDVSKLFDYNPEKWKHIESLFDITSLDELSLILHELKDDKEFTDRNRANNNGWRLGTLNRYFDFLSNKANPKSCDDNIDELDETQVNKPNMNLSPLILYGPPGTGKTYKMQTEYIDKFAEGDKFISTFHQSFSYEEFVEGLKPVVAEDKPDVINYKVVPGVFYNACERAAVLAGYEATENETALQKCITDSERYVKMSEAVKANKIVLLCIDEINRANVSAVFGDLISLIEPSKRIGAKNEMKVKLPYSKKDFAVPANLLIIGTMNTADRSIQLLDSALRRRFKFKELLPDYDTIENQKAKDILVAINARIRSLLDKDHQIGHSYFIDAEDDLDIFNALKDCVIPLLEEYFYNDAQKIREILKEKGVDNHYFYIKDDKAQDALKSMQLEYDSEKELFMLNTELAKVKDAAGAEEFIKHIV